MGHLSMTKLQTQITSSLLGICHHWHRIFIVGIVIVVAVLSHFSIQAKPAFAVSVPLSKQPPIVMSMGLGSEAGELSFLPNRLTFKAGTRYKLVLQNASPQKHYFTAKDFADAIWSQKVDAGNVEVKGAIHELELRPGSRADWVFIPLRAGIYSLRCTIPGHAEAGMVGTIEITG
jgi:uncharacterized cupredoxin-like copper-binding protein